MITHVISTEHSGLRDKSLCANISLEEGESTPFPNTTVSPSGTFCFPEVCPVHYNAAQMDSSDVDRNAGQFMQSHNIRIQVGFVAM